MDRVSRRKRGGMGGEREVGKSCDATRIHSSSLRARTIVVEPDLAPFDGAL